MGETIRKFATVTVLLLGLFLITPFGGVMAQVCVQPPTGLVSWWPAEGNANDMQGTNQGTLKGNAGFTLGKVGQAFLLNGNTGSIVEVPDALNLNFTPTSPMTIELWARKTSTQWAMHIVGKRDNCGLTSDPDISYGMGWVSGWGQNGLFFGWQGSDAMTWGGEADLPLNVWTHLASTFDGTTLKIYINGSLAAISPGTLGPSFPVPFKMGDLGTCGSFGTGFVGLLDEVSLYNRALTAEEIQAIYSAGSAGKCTTSVANAGPAQTVQAGALVQLDGSNSTPASNIVYQWAQISGPEVTLSDPTIAQPTFTAPTVGPQGASLTFRLTVTDQNGQTSQSTCIVTVTMANAYVWHTYNGHEYALTLYWETWVEAEQEAVSAGGHLVTINDEAENNWLAVTFNNSFSMVDGIVQDGVSDLGQAYIGYYYNGDTWGWISGEPVTYTNTLEGFPYDDGTHAYLHTSVHDLPGTWNAAPWVTEPWDNFPAPSQLTRGIIERPIAVVNPPMANAGPDQTVESGVTVYLDGSNSTPADSIVSYQWTQLSGPQVTLSDPTAAQPTFTAPIVGPNGVSLQFQLMVTNPNGQISLATCTVTVIPLVANAGPDQTVEAGSLVHLDGSNSNPSSSIVSYQWTQLSGPQVTLSDPTVAQPTFTAPIVGPNGVSLQFQLMVTDPNGQTSQDTCTVTVTFVNQPPIANAGTNQTVKPGALVILNGSGSTDSDDGIASYLWTQVSGPTVTLSDNTAVRPTFTAPDVGLLGASLRFQLRVTDNGGLIGTAYTYVNITWVNRPPVANAGPNQTVNAGDQVTLDGSASKDPDDNIRSYQWKQVSGPPVTLSSPSGVRTTFTAPHVSFGGATMIFQLTVTDSYLLRSTSTCAVNVLWVDTPPVVNAGSNIFILSKDQPITVITGTATDSDGDSLTYTWSEGNTQLVAGQVGPDGTAPFPLALIPSLPIGGHTFTLNVNDGFVTVIKSMLLTIENSPPTIAPMGEGTYQLNTPVKLTGQLSDYDGDTVSYAWFDWNNELNNGSLATIAGGEPVNIPPFTTSSLNLGAHQITLQVSDGVNDPVVKFFTVNVIDTTAPTITPMSSQTILWPPNGKMVPITILTNAVDNSGLPVNLAATLACNESGTGFWTNPVIDQATGVISLNLQAARAGNNKDGRQYTVTITATDQSGNISTANVKIIVPHDQGK
jgi:hypothetical protein